MEIIYVPTRGDTVFAIAGGTNPKTYFSEMIFTDEQLKICLPKQDYLRYCEYMEFNEGFGHFSSLFSLFSEDKPLILYTVEGGGCETCLEMFLKYGDGKRPDLDELMDMRTCMDDYDGNIETAVRKVEKLMEIMFPENLYKFENCIGVMVDVQGNFTWGRYQSHYFLPAASLWSHFNMRIGGLSGEDYEVLSGNKNKNNKKKIDSHWNMMEAVCLVASQPADAYSEERVEYYRQQIRNGKRLGCIAYKIKYISNYAIILDGHHRVLASMLEGVFPHCLLISEEYYRVFTKKDKTVLKLSHDIYNNRIDRGISGLQDEVLDFLRSKSTYKKYTQEGSTRNISEIEKLKWYKYYRSDTKNRLRYFPPEYEYAAEDMMVKLKEMIFNGR